MQPIENLHRERDREKVLIQRKSINFSDLRRNNQLLFARRVNILQEIINTERNYVYDLGVLVGLFLRPLQGDYSILSKDDVSAIFLNIEVIHGLSNELLCKLDHHFPNIDHIEPEAQIGSVFLQIGHYLKNYSTYCSNFRFSLEHMIYCEKNNSRFAQFLREQEKSAECKGLSFKDYLIKPVQRLCKYPLLFAELLKATPESHPDYNSVSSTQILFENVTQVANKISAEKENNQRIAQFQRTVENLPPSLDISQRHLCIEEWLHYRHPVSPSPLQISTHHVYLFEDILIVTRKKKRASGIKVRKSNAAGTKNEEFYFSTALKRGEVTPLDEEGSFGFILKEEGEAEWFTFLCNSMGSQLKWMDEIKRSLEASGSLPTPPKDRSQLEKKKEGDKKRHIRISSRKNPLKDDADSAPRRRSLSSGSSSSMIKRPDPPKSTKKSNQSDCEIVGLERRGRSKDKRFVRPKPVSFSEHDDIRKKLEVIDIPSSTVEAHEDLKLTKRVLKRKSIVTNLKTIVRENKTLHDLVDASNNESGSTNELNNTPLNTTLDTTDDGFNSTLTLDISPSSSDHKATSPSPEDCFNGVFSPSSLPDKSRFTSFTSSSMSPLSRDSEAISPIQSSISEDHLISQSTPNSCLQFTPLKTASSPPDIGSPFPLEKLQQKYKEHQEILQQILLQQKEYQQQILALQPTQQDHHQYHLKQHQIRQQLVMQHSIIQQIQHKIQLHSNPSQQEPSPSKQTRLPLLTIECNKCKELISRNEAPIEYLEKYYHPSCFVCASCSTFLHGKKFSHADNENILLCSSCFPHFSSIDSTSTLPFYSN
uniref:DH domain-containing protein n=1 Tax=Arcella intermedia TaxID=1963864 RepID=A0A6B2KY32_9EUKA